MRRQPTTLPTPRHGSSTSVAGAAPDATVAHAPPNPTCAYDMHWVDKIATQFPRFKQLLWELPIDTDWQQVFYTILTSFDDGQSVYRELVEMAPPPLTRRQRRGRV